MVIPIDLWAEVAVHAFLTLELIYLNSKLLFKPVAPGSRLILGGADTTPPQAISERLVRMGEGVEREGHLPLEGKRGYPIIPLSCQENVANNS